MSDAENRITELMVEAGSLPFGPTKVALLEEAVRIADSINDLGWSFGTRESLMEAAVFSGRPDILLVAFSWCLAQFDRHPQRFDAHDLLWKYKWVVSGALHFPEISRAKLEELHTDMERRYREYGSTMHATALERRCLHVALGELKLAKKAHDEFRKCRRDELSNCPACVINENCRYFLALRQWGRAVQAAQPVVSKGLTCMEEPHRVLGHVLRPLFHLGRIEEATNYQRQGYRLVGRANQFVLQHAEHLQFLTLVGDTVRAKQVFERHLPGALEAVELPDRFQFLLAAMLWCGRLADRGKSRVKVRLPKTAPAPDAEGWSDTVRLGGWFKEQAQAIARRFDARNGTRLYQEQIDELPELLKLSIE